MRWTAGRQRAPKAGDGQLGNNRRSRDAPGRGASVRLRALRASVVDRSGPCHLVRAPQGAALVDSDRDAAYTFGSTTLPGRPLKSRARYVTPPAFSNKADAQDNPIHQ